MSKNINRFTLRLTDEELEVLDNESKKMGLTKMNYMRYILLNPIKINYEYKNILKYSMQLEDIKNEWEEIINTILEQKILYRADIIDIGDKIKEMQKNQSEMLEDYQKNIKSMNRKINKLIRNI